MRPRAWLTVGMLSIVLLVAGCGSSDDRSAADRPTATTAAVVRRPGPATVVKLDVPATAPCLNNTYTTVSVGYETAGAARAELRVDGRSIPLSDPNTGTVSTDVRCDPLPHDFVLVAYDKDDNYTIEKRFLEVK